MKQHCPISHNRRTLGSAHQHSLRCQGRRNRSALANSPRFAPRQQKHSIKWLLKQTQIFPPDVSTTNKNNNANGTDKQPGKPPDIDPSLLHEQIDSYLTKTALILDAALHNFRHAADQQHFYQHTNDDANANDKQSDEPPNTDPSLLREQIDSYLTETAPILDAALHDFRHAADQQHL